MKNLETRGKTGRVGRSDSRYIQDEIEFRKTLYIECMKHNRQLKICFLAGRHNVKQYQPKTFLVCELSVSLLIFIPASGGQVHVAY